MGQGIKGVKAEESDGIPVSAMGNGSTGMVEVAEKMSRIRRRISRASGKHLRIVGRDH